jgi:outer membrane protein
MREPSHGLPAERRGGAAMMRFLAGTALALAATALAAEPLSLSEAMRMAGRSSCKAEAARLEGLKAREATDQIRSLYLPDVTLEGGHLNLQHQPELQGLPIHVAGMTLGPLMSPLADTSSWRYKFAVDYLVYDFGKRSRALEATKAKEAAINLQEGGEVRRVQAEVATRYVGLLHLKAQRRVLVQRRRTLEDHLKIVQDLYQHGVVARNDLLRTEVALRSLGDTERALDSAEAGAREAMNVAMGQEPTRALELPDELGAPPAIPWNEVDCRSRAGQSNEGVRALRAKVRALEGEVAVRRSDGSPNVVAQAFHQYEQNSFTPAPNQNGLYVGLSWKIFDGARASKVRQAASELDLGRRETREAENQAGNAAVAAYRDFQVALQEVRTSEANVAASEENFRILEDQYREGLAQSSDALDAEALLADSRFGLAARRYRAYAQQAVLLAVLGEDLPAFYDHALVKEP